MSRFRLGSERSSLLDMPPIAAALTLAFIPLVVSTCSAAWVPNGAPVTMAPGEQSLESTVPDGNGGAYVFWRDNRLGYDYAPRYDVFAQHLDAEGEVVAGWDPQGNPIANTDDHEGGARAISDGAGGAIVMWAAGNYRLQRVRPDGSHAWSSGGVSVSDDGAARVSGQVMPDGSGGVYVVWANAVVRPSLEALCPRCHPSYTYHLFAQRIDASGNRLWGAMGVPVTPDSIAGNVTLLLGNEGRPLILWIDVLGMYRAQELDSDGHARLQPDGQVIPHLRGGLTAATGPRQAVTVFNYGEDTHEDIAAQHLGPDLTVDWGESGQPIVVEAHKQEPTGMTGDGEGGVLLAWHDIRNAVSWDVYLTRVTSGGSLAEGWPDHGLPVCTMSERQDSPTLISDGDGGAYVAWIDLREPTNGYDLYLQRVLGTGTIAAGWPDQGLPICIIPQQQVNPQLVADGNGGVIVVWNDYRRGSEIYAQRIDAHGRIGDQHTAVIVSQAILTVDANDVTAEWQVDVAGINSVEVLRSSVARGVERLGTALINGSHRARFTDRDVPSGRYGYAIELVHLGTTMTTEFTWIDVVPSARLALEGFRPNPSNGWAPIAFVLPEAGPTQVEIFDIRGRRMRDLREAHLSAGSHSIAVGGRLPAGVYWIRLTAGTRSIAARGVVLD